jgi:chromosomal replication initiator protein
MHVSDIIAATSAEFGVPVTAILSKYRNREYVTPRHVAILLARDLTGNSLPRLARLMKRKDHTTIIHALNTIPQKIALDDALAATVQRIRDRLAAPPTECPCCGRTIYA